MTATPFSPAFAPGTRRGVSDAARQLEALSAEPDRPACASQLETERAIGELMAAAGETMSADWDEELGCRARWPALREAIRLMWMLGEHFPAPEAAIEPDGAIGLEWHRGHNRTLVVSVDGTSVLSYAAVLGVRRSAHGEEPLVDRVPAVISELLRRLHSE